MFSPQIETEAPVYIGIVRDYLTDVWNRLWPVVHKYLVIVWDFLSENVPLLLSKAQELLTTLASKVYELAPDFFSSVASWFAKLGEKIVEKLPDVLAVIQEYAVIAINLAVNLINSVLEWIQSMAGRYVVSLGSVVAFVLATLFPNSLSKKVLILRLAYQPFLDSRLQEESSKTSSSRSILSGLASNLVRRVSLASCCPTVCVRWPLGLSNNI